MNILDGFPALPQGLTEDDLNDDARNADAAIEHLDTKALMQILDVETMTEQRRDAAAIVLFVLLRQAYALGRASMRER